MDQYRNKNRERDCKEFRKKVQIGLKIRQFLGVQRGVKKEV